MANIPAIVADDPLEIRVKKRIVAVACEGIEAYLGGACDGQPYGFHWQESAFPYVTARTGPVTFDYRAELGTHVHAATMKIVLRIIVAHLTEGYRGEGEALLDATIQPVRQAFMCNPKGIMLRSDTFPYEPNWTDSVTGRTVYYLSAIGVNLESFSGHKALANAGTPGIQVGGEWSISVPLELEIGGF